MLSAENSLYVYNSLTGKKEPFKSLREGFVGMYVCGPTVYGEPHLGHARSAITFDVIYRYLSFLGYKVRYVRNITDVGHLEDEILEEGEDKIEKKARLESLEPMEVAQHYTNRYRETMHLLNVMPPSIEPAASGHIPEQISVIKKILSNGFAYDVNGSVYFDTHKYAAKFPYGQLSGRKLEEQLSGERELEGSGEKRHMQDFALWKKAGPLHIMKWDSPWSEGYPGWHIECTSMSIKYLGLPFDIHGGGMDLKFPHHEAEIAQSMAAFGKSPVAYWLHNNMVTLNGQKMAKSKGNFIALHEMFSGNHPLLERSYDPLTVRMFMLQAHYRSTLDFSNTALKAAEIALKKLKGFVKTFDNLSEFKFGDIDRELEETILLHCSDCYRHMNNDFNTAETIAKLFGLGKVLSEISKNRGILPCSKKTWDILGKTLRDFLFIILGVAGEEEGSAELDSDKLLDTLLQLRREAREEKDFLLADKLRDRLASIGIALKDNSDGTCTIEFTDYVRQQEG